MKLKYYQLICLFVLLTINVFSQSTYSEKFEKYEFTINSDTLLYRLFYPEQMKENYHFENVLHENLFLNIDKGKKFPLILFLHGAGERGSDNMKQLTYIDSVFANKNLQNENPCFVLAPQCPQANRWVEVDWKLDNHNIPEKPSKDLELVNLLIDSLIEILPIDKSRIYITGLSMGGFGTWDFIARYPEKFAAAVPICGGGDEKTASSISQIPIWCFHGSKDKVVKVERSRNMIDAIKDSGGNPKYTEYQDLGHLCWSRAYSEEELFKWLFIQKRDE